MLKFTISSLLGFLIVTTASTASAIVVTFSDRLNFDANSNTALFEDFESLGNSTLGIAGPSVLPSGLTVSSPTNSLFIVGPGQSSNPTTSIGSNSPSTDNLVLDGFGGSFTAFGVDLFQNNGGGAQFATPIDFEISLFNGAALIDSFITSVAPNGGSFFGVLHDLTFDSVQILSLTDSFEVIDNVAVGTANTVSVPVPGTLILLGTGLVFLARARRRGHTAPGQI